jgi:hypothetical protein
VILAVLISGSVAARAADPIGDPRGRALIARVRDAYRHVRAVEMSAVPRRSTFTFPRRLVLILRQGTVVAEEFTRPGSHGLTVIARRGGPAYARAAAARCWHRLRSSDPRTLVDVGLPFPYSRRGMKVAPPEATRFGWILKSEHHERYWFLAAERAYVPSPKRFVSYAIDARSHRIRSIYVQIVQGKQPKRWPAATLRVTTLTRPPRLPSTTPAC